MALASQYIDDGEKTAPVVVNSQNNQVELYNSATKNLDALRYYHFMLDTLERNLKAEEDIFDRIAELGVWKTGSSKKTEDIKATLIKFNNLRKKILPMLIIEASVRSMPCYWVALVVIK
jgi:hypothetical protein